MTQTITLYGIANCDTVRKARAWLTQRGVAHRFHDFARQGLPADVASWIATTGWEPLLNRKGTTWRKLDAVTRDAVVDAPTAMAVMQRNPSVVKRPVVDWSPGITIGFDPQVWERLAGR
ncbi:MAG: arsenate reductase [Ramlibacter sp.]|nr:arsenate reductase [Ramlibacter sp.]